MKVRTTVQLTDHFGGRIPAGTELIASEPVPAHHMRDQQQRLFLWDLDRNRVRVQYARREWFEVIA